MMIEEPRKMQEHISAAREMAQHILNKNLQEQNDMVFEIMETIHESRKTHIDQMYKEIAITEESIHGLLNWPSPVNS